MNKKTFMGVLLSAAITLSSAAGVFAATPVPSKSGSSSASQVTQPPASTATQKPASTATQKPASTATQKPSSSTSKATQKPSSNATQKPTASASKATQKPSSATNKPSATAAPSAAPSASPAPTIDPAKDNIIYMENESLDEPNIEYAPSAILTDAKSGRVLYSKNADDRMYPASTTKIMTAILILEDESMPFSKTVTASYTALSDIATDESHMGILTNEELSVEDLMYGMLVESANDAANVLAIEAAGSIEAFTERMNKKASDLGMTGTHFANACGVQDTDHYTTVSDMAKLAKYAMQNEKFREIVATEKYTIEPTNKYTETRNLVNTNLFLGNSRSSYNGYEPAIGIKTGHTSDAKYCLVSAAQNDGTELIAVVMGCDNKDEQNKAYSYIDSKKLFEFGFNNYTNQSVIKPGDVLTDHDVKEAKGGTKVSVTVEKEVSALLPNDSENSIEQIIDLPDEIKAPVKKGDILGTVSYSYNGTLIDQVNLLAANDVERNAFIHVLGIIGKVISSPLFIIPLILIILLLIFRAYRLKKRAKRRRRAQRERMASGGSVQRTPNRKASNNQRSSARSNSNARYTRDSNSRRK